MKNSEYLNLLEKRNNFKNNLLTTECKIAKEIIKCKISQLEILISKLMYQKNTETIGKFAKEVKMSGKFSQTGFWKLKKKLCPKSGDPPMAKKDEKGNLITELDTLKLLYMDTYKHRLRHRIIDAEYCELECMKVELWRRRMDGLVRNKAPLWTMKDLDKALSSLKNNQARDPLGMISDIFKPNIIGVELKKDYFTADE